MPNFDEHNLYFILPQSVVSPSGGVYPEGGGSEVAGFPWLPQATNQFFIQCFRAAPVARNCQENWIVIKMISILFGFHVLICIHWKICKIPWDEFCKTRLWQKIVCQELGQVAAEKVDQWEKCHISITSTKLTIPNYHGMGDRDTR